MKDTSCYIILHNNSDEVSITIDNKTYCMLCTNSDEGSMSIANERDDVLQNKSDKGSVSITQDFEEVEETEMRNNSATNDSNIDDLIEIIHHKNLNTAGSRKSLCHEAQVEVRRNQISSIAKKEQGEIFVRIICVTHQHMISRRRE